MSEELKPCPFCGGEADYEYDSDFGMVVTCMDCRAKVLETRFPSMKSAAEIWNTRAEQPDTPEQVRYIDDAYKAGWDACERERAERTCDGCAVPLLQMDSCEDCSRNYEDMYIEAVDE